MAWGASRIPYEAPRTAAAERGLSRETLITVGLLAMIPVLASVGPLGASVLLLRHGVTVAGSGPAQSVVVAAAVGLTIVATVAVAGALVVAGRRTRRQDRGIGR